MVVARCKSSKLADYRQEAIGKQTRSALGATLIGGFRRGDRQEDRRTRGALRLIGDATSDGHRHVTERTLRRLVDAGGKAVASGRCGGFGHDLSMRLSREFGKV